MQNKIVIIDYDMGNLRSVQKKFNMVGSNAIISNDPLLISEADKLVLPGVGNFSHGIKKIKEFGLLEVLNKSVLEKKTPILGICLGMQIMAKRSTEGGDVKGLGWFDADVVKFQANNHLKYKIPHMGWNNIFINRDSSLLKGLDNDSMYYFVHSYHMKCNDQKDILTTTDYENNFVSAINKHNIYGTQFHPEKSHDYGEKLIKNFVELI